MEINAISVSQLGKYLSDMLDAEEILNNIAVYGEISGRVSVSGGNAFFDLKDDGALIHCAWFGCNAAKIQTGDQVVIMGKPTFYKKRGEISFQIRYLQKEGHGALYQKFLELKEKLEKEGLFSASHKKEIRPDSVKRIGVVTSEDGAVIRDIINVATGRNPLVDIVLYPVKVQGSCAEKEVMEGVRFFDQYPSVDVIIIARGGGSFEDLNCFNSEALARLVYDCKKPIISAIGHETDFTLIDFVSDLRASTPSHAAQLITYNLAEKRLYTKKLLEKFVQSGQSYIKYTDDRLYATYCVLTNSAERIVKEFQYSAALHEKTLGQYNPVNILKQGYAKIERQGNSVNAASELAKGDNVAIYFKDGTADAKVESIRAAK